MMCDVSVWDFALPVMLGSLAGAGAGTVARRFMRDERPKTQAAIFTITHAAAFWLVGGLVFVLRQRRAHHSA
jgi:hypothetical protein